MKEDIYRDKIGEKKNFFRDKGIDQENIRKMREEKNRKDMNVKKIGNK